MSDDDIRESMMKHVAERRYARMFHNRIQEGAMDDWNWVSKRELKMRGRTAREFILELIRGGKRVTAGYQSTQIRGYHDHYVLWKEYK